MDETETRYFTNARLVCADRVVPGTLAVKAGRIEAVTTEPGPTSSDSLDLDGDFLLPGLVELHTDNLERHFMPRPATPWPGLPAMISHDAQMASAGITTVFDALTLGDDSREGDRRRLLHEMIDAFIAAQTGDLLRVEHFLHLRCEIGQPDTADLFADLVTLPWVRLVSIMDHTPGQRQFTSMSQYRRYHMQKHGLSEAEFTRLLTLRLASAAQHAIPNQAAILALARQSGLPLASHDDATADHVGAAEAAGMVIAEFPTTTEAARAARAAGLSILMGAPNIVRGGSHSGNIAGLALAELDLVDILSSDYVPHSLLHAAFILAESGIGWDLPRAIASVTATPAARVGLTDRGSLAPGLRADLIRVRLVSGLPLIRAVWIKGNRVM